MYNILLSLCCLYFMYHLNDNSFFHLNVKNKITNLMDFVSFICKNENNPLLLHYYDDDDDDDEKKDEVEVSAIQQNKEEKYENKYLEQFKIFSNDFHFYDFELEEEVKEYEKIKINNENTRLTKLNKLREELFNITEVYKKISDNDKFQDNDTNKKLLLDFNGFHDDEEEIPDYIHFDELYEDIARRKSLLEKEVEEIEQNLVTEDELKMEAHQMIVKNKLDKFVNNYILEHTPLGNIYMRYNNTKGSFEYFSNNTIPYRYLEPVGRRYVMTYWCKPIFVDIEEELKRAEVKFDEERKKKEEDEKIKREEIKNNPKNVMARMKNYNKDIKNQSAIQSQMRNRNALPPQIKVNLPNISQSSDKQLLKENANRYTWEGRLTDFCPLKKIDKKKMDKNLNMTYADFKRMQIEGQNKKYV